MLAQALKDGAEKVKGYSSIFSTDDFFMVDGEYQFDPTRLGEYHGNNLDEATSFMERCSPVPVARCIIDNTNCPISICSIASYLNLSTSKRYRK